MKSRDCLFVLCVGLGGCLVWGNWRIGWVLAVRVLVCGLFFGRSAGAGLSIGSCRVSRLVMLMLLSHTH